MPHASKYADEKLVAADDAVADPVIHICSLLHVHDVLANTRARYLVTVINKQMMLPTPDGFEPDNHLKIACNDIITPAEGLIQPTRFQVEDLVEFGNRWNRQGPLVVHCWAGISRSSAAAFILLCALNPDTDEENIAHALRRASATASPNRLLVQLGDDVLQRDGRMIAALNAMDRREDVIDVAKPFELHSVL